ncbi:MAG: hypothetical protein ACRDVP_02750 [Acidimicrobiales bacterium]
MSRVRTMLEELGADDEDREVTSWLPHRTVGSLSLYLSANPLREGLRLVRLGPSRVIVEERGEPL